MSLQMHPSVSICICNAVCFCLFTRCIFHLGTCAYMCIRARFTAVSVCVCVCVCVFMCVCVCIY